MISRIDKCFQIDDVPIEGSIVVSVKGVVSNDASISSQAIRSQAKLYK